MSNGFDIDATEHREAIGALCVTVVMKKTGPGSFEVRTVIDAPSGYRYEPFWKYFPTREWAEQAYAQQLQAWINE